MAIIQPQASDTLLSNDHAKLHRVIASDGSAPDQSFTIDSSGNASIATGKSYQVNGVNLIDTDNTLAGNSDVKVPSQKAIKTYADGLVAGLLDYRGVYDASVNTYPATGGSGTAGAILKGDMWVISVAGTLGGVAIQIGDSIIANTDTPGQTAGNWNTLNTNISYVPEDSANKVTSISGASTDTQYPSAKLTYDQLALKANLISPSFTTPALGTPSSGTLTSCSGLPVSGITASTSTALGVGSIELGHASDTTIARVSAGVVSIEGNNIITTASGGTLTGEINMGENAGFGYDSDLSADGKYSGLTLSGTAGATLAFGDICSPSGTSNKWVLADANVITTASGDGRGILGVCVLAANDTQATKMLLHGMIRADAKFPTLTINEQVFLSETAGAVTLTKPTTADSITRCLGFGTAGTGDNLFFNPSSDYETHV